MFAGLELFMILIFAFMMAFTTIKRDGIIEIAVLFLIGMWLVNL